ncbi:PAS domain S-box protein [Actinoplanes sp. NPDC051861]|uniref:hybrid sensor histidine kinase/response regulator n=1 Tax=Actinoplanes sp. NPDC051861 TaxID=3155170 RepID=UPI0034314CB0
MADGSPGPTVLRARPVLLLALGYVSVIAAIDAVAPPSFLVMNLIVAGPVIAALAASARVVLLTGLYAAACGSILTAWPNHFWGTRYHIGLTMTFVSVTAAAAVAAEVRRRFEVAAWRAESDRRALASIVETSDESIIATDLAGHITVWNRGACELFGYPASEAIGHHLDMTYRPRDAGHIAESLQRVGKGDRIHEPDVELVRSDGEVANVSVVLSPIRDATGNVCGICEIVHDISEQKRIEERERERSERAQNAQHLQSLGQLAGGIAHDFNNLLAIIGNYADLVDEQVAGHDGARADLDRIRVAADRATGLARQLIVFARGEPTPTAVFDLNTTVVESHSLLARTLGTHIQLVTRPAPDPVPIDADQGQINQVLLNLAINARDAMPDGGTIVVEAGIADVDDQTSHVQPALPPGRYARLAVSDTGTGMSADVAAHIFEPFFSTKPQGEGTGIGLATVYGIISHAGGGIHVYSELNIGTTMRVYLPLAPLGSGAEAAAVTDVVRGDGQVVLVVDDEDDLRAVVERILIRAGYAVMTCSNGEAALPLAVSGRCDLLLSDLIMPGMSGRRLAELVRERAPELPVLFMSGYSDGLLIAKGAFDLRIPIVQKPFTAAALSRAIHRALSSARAGHPVRVD